MPIIHVLSPGSGLRSFTLSKPSVTFGRGADCDVSLPEESRLSRVHLRFEQRASGGWAAIDAGSSNGTTYMGQRIAHHVIADGDLLCVGQLQIQVRLTDQPPTLLGGQAAKTSDDALQAAAVTGRVSDDSAPLQLSGDQLQLTTQVMPPNRKQPRHKLARRMRPAPRRGR